MFFVCAVEVDFIVALIEEAYCVCYVGGECFIVFSPESACVVLVEDVDLFAACAIGAHYVYVEP